MKTVTARQIQRLDKIAIEQYGISSLVLMENAGRTSALEITQRLKKAKLPLVCVVCGMGNNGGDGFVIARHLLEAGIKVKIFLVCKVSSLSCDAKVNYNILRKLKYSVVLIKNANLELFQRSISGANVVVDAIFGVGLSRDVKDVYKNVIETVNNHARYVYAVDVPSGLDATTGKVLGVCVRADTTLTFTFAKTGFGRAEGSKHCGKVKVIDIGIPKRIKGLKL